jgi:hypothetical protein
MFIFNFFYDDFRVPYSNLDIRVIFGTRTAAVSQVFGKG